MKMRCKHADLLLHRDTVAVAEAYESALKERQLEVVYPEP